MSVIIARLSAGADRRADRRAHFFDPEYSLQPGGMRQALCGFTAHESVLEPLPDAVGPLPCELCIARTSPHRTLAPDTQVAVPADDVDSRRIYAVGLRGESEWHRVPEHPVMQIYEGREVVVTECGVIGFLLFGTPPPGYEPCDACPPFKARPAQDDQKALP
ncbi:hypothetical protein [Saccharopolyspora endophytica]|uniref:Uncharacterized protein n=1 Tax=Saccharopolyspora endophytica TaxID=543886 RepID=A0ABS5DQS2_9PSEU|nr:hypothetical protein [Saccharopolyspora endophytica]MBQ0928644.1 hypothetical protein [Saccharopolyspora endophytica]